MATFVLDKELWKTAFVVNVAVRYALETSPAFTATSAMYALVFAKLALTVSIVAYVDTALATSRYLEPLVTIVDSKFAIATLVFANVSKK